MVRWIVWRKDGSPASQIAYRDRVDLNRRLGNLGHAQHRPSRRSLGEIFSEDAIHFSIVADIFQINLGVDDVLDGQSRGFDDHLDVIEGLSSLGSKSRG